MDQCCATDMYKVAKELRSLLVAHDNAVRKIDVLDGQINQINHNLLVGDFHPQTGHASRCHIQLSVLSGVRHMLDMYRLCKHQQIQDLSRSIITTLSQNRPDQGPDNTPDEDSDLLQSNLDLSSSWNDTDLSLAASDLDLSSSVSEHDTSSFINDHALLTVSDRSFSPGPTDRAAINYTTLSREQYRTE